MTYFESEAPSGSEVLWCDSDNREIPRGTGYLYVDSGLVEFRRPHPRLAAARAAVQKKHESREAAFGGMGFGRTVVRFGPLLLCEGCAMNRNLALDIAAADARRWWKTGRCPFDRLLWKAVRRLRQKGRDWRNSTRRNKLRSKRGWLKRRRPWNRAWNTFVLEERKKQSILSLKC